MEVGYKLPFTVVNLRIHGWLTHALIEQDHESQMRLFYSTKWQFS